MKSKAACAVVWIITWSIYIALIVCCCFYFAKSSDSTFPLKIFDVLLILLLFLAIAVAITFSNAYTQELQGTDIDWLLEKATRLKLTFLHACICWNIVAISLIILPVYTSCSVIFLTAENADSNPQSARITLYSIISLVSSLSIYIIQPQNRSIAYRRGFSLLQNALIPYRIALLQRMQCAEVSCKEIHVLRQKLQNAIREAENLVSKHYSQTPN